MSSVKLLDRLDQELRRGCEKLLATRIYLSGGQGRRDTNSLYLVLENDLVSKAFRIIDENCNVDGGICDTNERESILRQLSVQDLSNIVKQYVVESLCSFFGADSNDMNVKNLNRVNKQVTAFINYLHLHLRKLV